LFRCGHNMSWKCVVCNGFGVVLGCLFARLVFLKIAMVSKSFGLRRRIGTYLLLDGRGS